MHLASLNNKFKSGEKMLSYEKLIYEEIKESCKCSELDFLIEANKTSIKKYAYENKLNVDDVKKQIKLHAPQFEKKLYTTRNFLKKYIFPILDGVFNNYHKIFSTYLKQCGGNLIDNHFQCKYKNHNGNKSIVITNGKSEISAEIKLVDSGIGNYIENYFHYLRSARSTPVLQIGLFIKNHSWPICYMCFCSIDRDDKLQSLNKSLNISVDKNSVVELSRVFGFGNLPQNTISLLVGYAAKLLKKKNYQYIVTAVNITLGFSGHSMLASQFVPYAIRPVTYSYNHLGKYCTIRNEPSLRYSTTPMPPNILFVREIEPTRCKELKYCKLVDIGNNFSFNETAIEHEIYEIRRDLEGAWNKKTRYHRTINDGYNYISKGQCGVSSLLLAKILERRGYEVYFCEGDVLFPIELNSIINHCWIKIVNYNRRKQNVIIDITADQNGYKQKIIFKTEEDLKKLKFTYITKSEKKPENVDVEHVIKRLEYLENELNNGGIFYE